MAAVEIPPAPVTPPTWTTATLPLPTTAALSGSLYGVSCTSPTSCSAVGDYYEGSLDAHLMAETLSNGTWVATSLPAPPDSRGNGPSGSHGVNGASCASATSCIIVGDYDDGSGYVQPLIETLTNGQWTAAKPAGVAGASLAAVSCVSTTSCFAVGVAEDSNISNALVETLADGTWTPTTLRGFGDTQLLGVSCRSATSCTAVGNTYGSGDLTPLVETLADGTWTQTAPPILPRPPGTTGPILANLLGVSCVSTTTCTAVGYDIGLTNSLLVETLADGTWTPTELPTPSGARNWWTQGLFCASATSCMAAGYDDSPTDSRLLYVLSDGEWTQADLPPIADSNNILLTSISCTSDSSCVAAGSGVDPSGMYAEPFAQTLG
jgi:hypothetical protein